MHIGLIVINSHIGGTEKRFGHLFNYLKNNSQVNNYSLLVPEGLFQLLANAQILRDDQDEIIRVFQNAPYSIYNNLPNLRFLNLRGTGLTEYLGFLWKQELKTKKIKDFFNSLDAIHYALPTSYLLGVLPLNKPIISEAQSSTLSFLKDRFVIRLLNSPAIFNCASKRIMEGYQEALPSGEQPSERLYLSPCSFTDYSRTYIANKEKIITFAGRISSIKNPKLFVQVIYELSRRRQDFSAYMLGTGNQDRMIDNLIKKYRLEDILTRQYHPNPPEILSRSLVFVSIQQYDNYHSQALMEAMACGCAIVASDLGETWKLVSHESGFRVPLDAKAIANHLEYLLDNFDLATDMGRAARRKVIAEQNISIYSQYLEDLYNHAHNYWSQNKNNYKTQTSKTL